MDHRIEAIYESGVFKPLNQVALPDHSPVVLWIETDNPEVAEAEVVDRQKRAMALLDAELEQVADNSPADGLSSSDHDQILYGGHR